MATTPDRPVQPSVPREPRSGGPEHIGTIIDRVLVALLKRSAA